MVRGTRDYRPLYVINAFLLCITIFSCVNNYNKIDLHKFNLIFLSFSTKGVYETIWKRNVSKSWAKIYRNMSKLVNGKKTLEEMADWTDGEVLAYCNQHMRNCYVNLSNLILRPSVPNRYQYGSPRTSVLCQQHSVACFHWTMQGKYWDDTASAWVTP